MPYPTQQIFVGAGPILFGSFDVANGKPAHGYITSLKKAAPEHSMLTFTPEAKNASTSSGESGIKRMTKRWIEEMTGKIELTLEGWSRRELDIAMFGESAQVAAGAVTAEACATVAVGDYLITAHPQISDLVITDATGSPVTLTEGTHYTIVSAAQGQIRIDSLTGLTQPLSLAYDHAAQTSLRPMRKTVMERSLVFLGFSREDPTVKLRVRIPKVSWDTSPLALQNDNKVMPIKLTGEVMYVEELADDADFNGYMAIDNAPADV